MNPKHLIFRADGNNSIGTGHIMRCLSLAIANQTQGGVSTIISYSDDTELLNRVKDANINLIHPNSSYSKKRDIEFTVSYIQQLPNAVMKSVIMKIFMVIFVYYDNLCLNFDFSVPIETIYNVAAINVEDEFFNKI